MIIGIKRGFAFQDLPASTPEIMTLQTDLRYLAFYLCDLAGFLQFSKITSKMPTEIQQCCRCSAFSKISPKSHYLYWVRILVSDLLFHNFPAHLCSLIAHHINSLLKAKDINVLSTFSTRSDAVGQGSSDLLWKASKLLEGNLAERFPLSAHAMLWNFACEWLDSG